MTVGKKSVGKYKERQAEKNEREEWGVSCNKDEEKKRVMVKYEGRKREKRGIEGKERKGLRKKERMLIRQTRSKEREGAKKEKVEKEIRKGRVWEIGKRMERNEKKSVR